VSGRRAAKIGGGRTLLLIGGLTGLALLAQAALFLPACGKDRGKEEKKAASADSLPSLQTRLDSMKSAFLQRAPDDLITDYELGLDELRRRRVGQRAPLAGHRARPLALPGIDGDTVRLAELLKEGPVVLTWYRGGWCPYCNAQLAALQQALPAIREAGGQLVAVGPDLPDSTAATARRHGLDFHVLSDVGNAAARRWDLLYDLPERVARRYAAAFDLGAWSGHGRAELPLTPTYVIDRTGTIRYAFLSLDYRERAEPMDIVRALKALPPSGG
jgi:peroxiredoxin